MVASCINKHAGLITGHAYTLLDTIILSNGQKLIKMRNPWSAERYTGPYNDADPIWTDALMEEAGMEKKDDGKIYMPVPDFKIAFTTYQVLMYKNENGENPWHKHQIEVSKTGERHWFKFTPTHD